MCTSVRLYMLRVYKCTSYKCTFVQMYKLQMYRCTIVQMCRSTSVAISQDSRPSPVPAEAPARSRHGVAVRSQGPGRSSLGPAKDVYRPRWSAGSLRWSAARISLVPGRTRQDSLVCDPVPAGADPRCTLFGELHYFTGSEVPSKRSAP